MDFSLQFIISVTGLVGVYCSFGIDMQFFVPNGGGGVG